MSTVDPDRWKKLESIFNAALGVEEDRRAEMLKESCGGDESLRSEVESLLHHHQQAGSFQSAVALAEATKAAKQNPVIVGASIAQYRVLEEIGGGGMGVVYKAEDVKLGRLVALKFLTENIATDPLALQRFQREARAASALNHPNICTIYDIEDYEGGQFIAMEYVEGQTLKQRIVRGPLSSAEAAKLGIQIAGALAAAHSKGVVHRDIKPGNLIITESGLVKVLDFGLAKLLRAEPEAVTAESLTETRTVAGTLPYMSPEQLRGREVDARTDIYALGVVLYEMCTGRRPFSAELMPELVDQILNRPAPAPRKANPNISVALERTVIKCLAKEPQRRYQTAKEVADELHAVTGASEIVRLPLRIPRLTTRAKLGLLAATIAALLLLVGILTRGRFWEAGRGGQINSIAVLPFTNSTQSADSEYLSDGMVEKLIEDLSRLPQMRVISRISAFHYKGKEIDPVKVGRELDVGAILVGTLTQHDQQIAVSAELINTRDRSRIWGKSYEESVSGLEALNREIAADVTGQLRNKLTTAQVEHVTGAPGGKSEGYQDFLKGMYHLNKYTPDELEQSKIYFQQSIDKDPVYAPSWGGLAYYYALVADFGVGPPSAAWPKSKEAAEKALAIDSNVASAQETLCSIRLLYDWNWNGAGDCFSRAEAEFPSAELHRQHAIYFRTVGQGESAIAQMRKGEEMDPLSATMSGSLGWTYFYLHRYPEAVRQFQATVAMENTYLEGHFGLANAYYRNGQKREAAEEFENYLRVQGDPDDASTMGKISDASGPDAAMRWLWQRQLEAAQQQTKQEYVSPMLFATTYSLLGDKEQTLAWLEKAYAERSTKLVDLKLDPDFGWLHSESRFEDLVKRIGLP